MVYQIKPSKKLQYVQSSAVCPFSSTLCHHHITTPPHKLCWLPPTLKFCFSPTKPSIPQLLLRISLTLSSFKQELKTHLYKETYSSLMTTLFTAWTLSLSPACSVTPVFQSDVSLYFPCGALCILDDNNVYCTWGGSEIWSLTPSATLKFLCFIHTIVRKERKEKSSIGVWSCGSISFQRLRSLR